MNVYFSHPAKTEFDGTAKILLKVLQRNFPTITFINPFNSPLTHQYLNNLGDEKTAKKIVEKDLIHIRESQLMVAYQPYISRGTTMEIFYARTQCYIPVIIYKCPDHQHPWLLGLNCKIVQSLDKLIKEIGKVVENEKSKI